AACAPRIGKPSSLLLEPNNLPGGGERTFAAPNRSRVIEVAAMKRLSLRAAERAAERFSTLRAGARDRAHRRTAPAPRLDRKDAPREKLREPALRERRTHEIDEVVAIKTLARSLVRRGEARFEPLQRIAPAFDVRVVGREQHHFRPRFARDPGDVFRRIRRGADLAAHVVARLEAQLLQPFLVAPKRVGGAVEKAHPTRDPARALLDH